MKRILVLTMVFLMVLSAFLMLSSRPVRAEIVSITVVNSGSSAPLSAETLQLIQTIQSHMQTASVTVVPCGVTAYTVTAPLFPCATPVYTYTAPVCAPCAPVYTAPVCKPCVPAFTVPVCKPCAPVCTPCVPVLRRPLCFPFSFCGCPTVNLSCVSSCNPCWKPLSFKLGCGCGAMTITP